MTSRERVFRALEFRRPDRAPRDYWALPWVSQFAAAEFAALTAQLPSDMTGVDVLAAGERQRGQQGRKGTYVDAWGCAWEAAEDGVVGEVKHPPLADWSALRTYQPPWEIVRKADWDAVNRAQEANLAGQKRFFCCFTHVRPFERMQFLRGSENLFLDLGYDSAEFHRLREMVHEFFLATLDGYARTDCDALSLMDDWGSQQSLLISPAMWRDVFKPMYKDYCDRIHGAGKKVFFHSDGHIFDIYEDLIEIGVDAVNSQLFCMDIEAVARQFKGRITFWGEIDRQHVLPFGTVQDVRRAVGRVRRALDDGTGGVFAQCEWGVNNPPANVRAVYEAWLEPIDQLP